MTHLWTAAFAGGAPLLAAWVAAGASLVFAVFAGGLLWRRRPPPLERKQAAGSRIALAIGSEFAPASRFTGFVHEASGASIVLIDLHPEAFEQLKLLGDTTPSFAAQGVSAVSRRRLTGRTGDHIYLRGEQKTALVDYAKYILIFRENGVTGVITANIPGAALTSGLIRSREVEAILRSAEVRSQVPQAPALFTLGYVGPFEEDISLLGTAKGYRLKSTGREAPAGLEPIFLVAPSLAQAPVPDLGHLANRTFDGLAQICDKTLEAAHRLEVGGLDAVAILGHGSDATSGEAAFVYQLIVAARHGGYFRLVGVAAEAMRESILPEFKKIAESFRPAE